MKQTLLRILSRFPRLKAVLRYLHDRLWLSQAVSASYVLLQEDQAAHEGQRLRDAWQSDLLPARQRELVETQLLKYRRGEHVDVFDAFIETLKHFLQKTPGASLLEIGCSSGYYSEVLKIADIELIYFGCDYSPAFINLAKKKYPTLDFRVEDATALHYPDRSFDIAVSGNCLLHIPDYEAAVAETARVTRSWAVFHRTPVVFGQPERWYRKQAYGVETVEIHFNEQDFVALLDKYGLEALHTYTLHEERSPESPTMGHAVRTYACRKRP